MNDCDRFDSSTIFNVFQEATNLQKKCVFHVPSTPVPHSTILDGKVHTIILDHSTMNASKPCLLQTKGNGQFAVFQGPPH